MGVGGVCRLLAASGLLLALRVGFVVLSFASTRDRLLWVTTLGARAVPGSPSPERVVWAVEVADRRVPGSRTCLMRSLTAETLLVLYGYDPVHRIGVDTDGESTFLAHSWLEWEGRVIIGDLEDLSKFEPLPPLDEYDGDIP
jgi:hypothetical protein